MSETRLATRSISVPDVQTYADYQRYNFFRTPDWRWERVLAITRAREDGRPGRCTHRDDDVVRVARAFILKWRRNDPLVRERLQFENPGLHYAYHLHVRTIDHPNIPMYIQARLLARQTPEEVAAIMGLHPAAVAWYTDLFFDVLPYLDQRDWITEQVLLPAIVRSDPAPDPALPPGVFRTNNTIAKPFMDGSLKLMAYFGGPYMVDAYLAAFDAAHKCTSRDAAPQWLDKTILDVMRRRTAQCAALFDINKYNMLEVLDAYAKLLVVARSAESVEQDRTAHERRVKAVLEAIPWTFGSEGERAYGNTLVGQFDRLSSELRTDELLRLASGRVTPQLEENFPTELPPPRNIKVAVSTSEDSTKTELP